MGRESKRVKSLTLFLSSLPFPHLCPPLISSYTPPLLSSPVSSSIHVSIYPSIHYSFIWVMVIGTKGQPEKLIFSNQFPLDVEKHFQTKIAVYSSAVMHKLF